MGFLKFDLLEAGMELKKVFGNDARMELICERFGFSICIKLLHGKDLFSYQFAVTHEEICVANMPIMNLKFKEAINKLVAERVQADKTGSIISRCEV